MNFFYLFSHTIYSYEKMIYFSKEFFSVCWVKKRGWVKILHLSCAVAAFCISVHAQNPSGAFYSPSTTIIQSPNSNSAIGINPQSDWKLTIDARGNASNPQSFKGLDIWTNAAAGPLGEPIMAQDAFRVRKFTLIGSNHQFPQDVF